MATAAPAASGQSAGTGAGQGTGNGEGQGTGTGAITGGAPDIQRVSQLPSEMDGGGANKEGEGKEGKEGEQKRTARPIKPIPNRAVKLPGVDDISGPGFDLPPAPKARVRLPDGTFTKADGSPSAKVEGQEGQPPAEGAELGPDGQPIAGDKFEFAGETWEGDGKISARARAEASFKTLRGMHRALEHRASTAEVGLKEARGRAWDIHAAYQDAVTRLQQYESGQAPPRAAGQQPGQEGNQPTAPKSGDGIDWQLYREIRRQADAAGHPEAAEQWLQEQMIAQTDARVKKLLEEALGPVKDLQQEREYDAAAQQVFDHTEQLATRLKSYVEQNGQPTFPELHDSALAEAVGRNWVSMGLDPRSALTESGLIAAIGLYRMVQARQASASPAANPTPSNAGTSQHQLGEGTSAVPRPDVDAGVDAGGPPFNRPAVDEKNVPPEVRRLRAAFGQPTQINRVGFDR